METSLHSMIQKNHATVYQLDCETQNKGKLVASTKRRIRWRFGFADIQAIQSGKTGNDCRGAEHEVVFVWSRTSGKQLILADGQEVHWAKCNKGKKMEVSWDMLNGNHKLAVIANSSKARPFDLLIDGRSFYDMPKLYELGNTDDVAAVAVQAPTIARPRAPRSYSMPDLLDLPTTTVTPKRTVHTVQRSPTSSMDMTPFHHASPPMPQATPNQQRHHSWNPATTTPTQQAAMNYNFSWNDAPTPTYQHNSSSLSCYSQHSRRSSVNDDDSQVSAALAALGVDLDAMSLHGDDSVISMHSSSHLQPQFESFSSFNSMPQAPSLQTTN